MIQEEVTIKVGGAIQPLDQVKKKYQEIDAATKSATKSARDHQQEVSRTVAVKGPAAPPKSTRTAPTITESSPVLAQASGIGGAFRTLGQRMADLTTKVRGFFSGASAAAAMADDKKRAEEEKKVEKNAKERGKAVGKIGAAAGIGTLGKLGEASGLGGGLGAFAIGAAIVGSAFKTLDQVVGELTERIRGNIQAQRGMQDAIQGAKDKRQADAFSQVMSEANIQRRLIFRGGDTAASYAIGMGKDGVDRKDALEAMLELQDIKPGYRSEVLLAATRAARTGEITAADAVRSVKDSQVLQHLAKSGQDDELAASMIAKSLSPADVEKAGFRLRKFEETDSPRIKALDDIQANENKRQELNANESRALAESMKRLGEAFDPVGKAVLDFNNGLQREIEMQQKLIDQMGFLEKAWDRVTGNKEALRLTRLQQQAGAASDVVPVNGSTP